MLFLLGTPAPGMDVGLNKVEREREKFMVPVGQGVDVCLREQ